MSRMQEILRFDDAMREFLDVVDPEWEEEHRFEPCQYCDGHDACYDFGCAIEQGIIDTQWY